MREITRALCIAVALVFLMGCTNKEVSNSQELYAEIENQNGKVKVFAPDIINEFSNIFEDKRNMTNMECSFENNVSVIVNSNKSISFKIANDGHPIALSENNMQYIIPGTLYNKLELIMQKSNNSLALNGAGNPKLLDESNTKKQNIQFEIYLVDGLKTHEATQASLDKLRLKTTPILVNYEIKQYDWEKHEFELKTDSLAKSSSAVINDKANDDKKQKDNSKDFATLFKMLEGCCLYMKPYAPIFNSIFSAKNAEESRINTNARKIDGESSIIEGVEYSVNND
jgi:hypothetical protein